MAAAPGRRSNEVGVPPLCRQDEERDMDCNFEGMFGQEVGRGSQATVYAREEYAVKLYREGYPKVNVFDEAYIMANLERVNFPSPKVYEILLVNGRYGLRMDKVRGRVMSEEFLDHNPKKIKNALNVLVDLQIGLQKYDTIAWAADLKRRFQDDIVCNERLSADLREKLMEDLGKLPDGQALCHCDFHAGNVFFDGEKYMIIDLLQISRGDPAADAACSYVAYSFTHEGIAEYYLNRYCEKSGIAEERVRLWLPVYAGTLLGRVPEHFTPIIERFV